MPFEARPILGSCFGRLRSFTSHVWPISVYLDSANKIRLWLRDRDRKTQAQVDDYCRPGQMAGSQPSDVGDVGDAGSGSEHLQQEHNGPRVWRRIRCERWPHAETNPGSAERQSIE